jgi:hypothetical protein
LLKCIGCVGSHIMFSFINFDKFCDILLGALHFTITKTLKKPHNTTDSHHSSKQKHHEWKQGERSRWWWRVALPLQTWSDCNRIIALIGRPNTDSVPNIPVQLLRKQRLLRYVIMSPVHTVTIRCHGTRKRYKCVPSLRRIKRVRE